MRGNCFNCGQSIIVSNLTKECENCTSKHFLIENQFLIKKVIGQGGFGRIYKCIHIKTGKLVAIKERLEVVLSFEDEMKGIKIEKKKEIIEQQSNNEIEILKII